MEKDKVITKGEYIIPEDCRAMVAGGKVFVFPKKQKEPTGYRCRDCVHYRKGQTSINQFRDSFGYICEMKPKEVHNPKFAGQRLFYSALKYGKICSHFEKKGGNGENEND